MTTWEGDPREHRPPRDLPRDELLRCAEEAVERYGPIAFVHFKYTCEQCGERCTLEEPNMLRENGECFRCGHSQPIREGGFLLVAPGKGI